MSNYLILKLRILFLKLKYEASEYWLNVHVTMLLGGVHFEKIDPEAQPSHFVMKIS